MALYAGQVGHAARYRSIRAVEDCQVWSIELDLRKSAVGYLLPNIVNPTTHGPCDVVRSGSTWRVHITASREQIVIVEAL